MHDIKQLQSQIDQLRKDIVSVGPLRPGTIAPHNRKCGKPNCHCARSGDPGHRGWQLKKMVDARQRCRGIPKYALDETRRQVDEYARFMRLVSEFAELNEALCDLRLKQSRLGK